MSDFSNSFWNMYIALLTLLGVFGCAILLWVQSIQKSARRPTLKNAPRKTQRGDTPQR
jgi:cytochrome c oxidase cbb3-type subunit 3